MATLSWRPDLWRHGHCEVCRTALATVGNLCVACDHERWQQESNGNGNGAQLSKRPSPPVTQWMGGKDGRYVQIAGDPVPEYMQLADWEKLQRARDEYQDARELAAWASGR